MKWMRRRLRGTIGQSALRCQTPASAFTVEGATRRTQRTARRGKDLRQRAAAIGRASLRIVPYAVLGLLAAGAPMAAYRGYVYLLTSPHFALTSLTIEGNSNTREDEILRATGLGLGVNVLGVDEDAAEAQIARLPWVKRVDVTRSLPDSVAISIQERKPVAVVAEKETWLVDDDGSVFKILEPSEFSPDLLVVSGVEVTRLREAQDERRLRETVGEALALAHAYAAAGLEKFYRLRGVDYDEILGYSLVTEGRQRIMLGTGEYAQKMARLTVVLADLDRRNAAMQTIRMDNEKQPWKVAVAGSNLRFPAGASEARVTAVAREMLP